jgi:CBS domain-containing protein
VVDDVMQADPLVVAPEDTLGEIAERLRERDLGYALVCDYGRLIGILTSSDLVEAYAERVHPSEGRAREWMTAEPVAVVRGTSIDEAALLMSKHTFDHLPVVDDDARPLGVVALHDALRAGAAPVLHIGLGL